MRVAAGLLILVICSAWGFRRSLLLKRRCTLLRELRLLVEQYSIEISCTAPTLAELAGNSGGEFGRELGTCPAESQLALLKLYSARFDKLISAAEKSAEQQGRMYRSGGVLAGLGAAVMLL